MERHPELLFAYNPRFDQTNTSQSLLCAIDHVIGEDVLWLNGDVVFDRRIIAKLLRCPSSCMAVITSKVSEEEVKFELDKDGWISAVSKTVANGSGEAIGINLVRTADLPVFTNALKRCSHNDYF